ncbi:efflux RND transporter periplasmic adaptor subunit [Candidatus Beckwithbacteria bacterium]|nr:efflux RND transporter periplasmic adaptor subunit [Candidatus Beckwithbacteria bacterium]
MKIHLPGIFKNHWFFFLLILILIFGGYFYWQSKHKKIDTANQPYTISRMDLSEYVTASGQIGAKDLVSLKFQTPGRLTWVNAQEGDYVQKWQTIAAIDEVELQQNIKKSLLTYMNSRMDFDQTKADYKDSASTNEIERVLIKNQNNLDTAVLNVEIVDLAKKYAYLVSPIDGILVKATDKFAGINTSATTEYVVVDPKTLRFEAEIEELDIAKVEENMAADITLDAFPGEKISSNINKIDFTISTTSSGNSAFVAYLPMEFNNKYRLGMNGDIKVLVTEKQQVLAVPIDRVIEKEDGKYVTVIKNNKQEEVKIETGVETDDYYEVLSGLNEGDQIATALNK